MDDRLKETLSAMMDDQADELSVRRLLSSSDSDEARDQWRRWQRLRDLMQDREAARVNVSARVNEALSGGAVKPVEEGTLPPVKTGSARTMSTWRWPVPAMLALALVVGFGAGSDWEFANPQAARTADAGTAGALPASGQTQIQQEEGVPEITLQGLSDDQRQHLGRYLLEHAQHSSVAASRGSLGYARLTSMSAASEPY
ncbi:MAG: sigma-E factor negative regulatory protein [Oleiphilaceae bacterium]|nr:sigma-E factor negative regulatory protein [Oleiphilaceae bacterium]